MSLVHGRIDSTLSGTDGRYMLTPNMSLQTGRIDKRSDHFSKVAKDSFSSLRRSWHIIQSLSFEIMTHLSIRVGSLTNNIIVVEMLRRQPSQKRV